MTEEQKITVTNIVRNTINLIAAKEYEKMPDLLGRDSWLENRK